MAVRFFERIAKTYRREQWDALLRPLLSTWYRCAQQLGNMELSVQLLFEILGHGMQMNGIVGGRNVYRVLHQVLWMSKTTLKHWKRTYLPS